MAKQSSKDVAINRFEAGMSLDIDELLQKANTMAYASNIRFVSRDNTVYVLTNIKGTVDEAAMSGGYIPIGVANKNGIAYIVSAKISGGVATGDGQIGTFPSPDYSTGNITQAYRPLQNYSGDVPQDPLVYGDFTSVHFGFDLRYDLDVELQNSYDGSLNIVITDGSAPMKIINSGFVVLPDRKYFEVDQSGTKDTNRYDLIHWDTTINLVQTSSKIAKLTFEGVDPGGNLKAGNYTYFFRYATQDGDETDVFESSRIVSIFPGDNPSNIKGGAGDGEVVAKTAKFNISNLDQSYARIIPYFTWISGVDSSIIQAVRIDTLIPISGTEQTFYHTGYEEVSIIDVAEISISSGSLETARTIAQFQGRLFGANIQTKNTHDQDFLDFAKTVFIGSKEEQLDTPDFKEISDMIIASNNQVIPESNGWNNGYYNPRNIYDKLSYMGGETYPYRMVFILPDGSSSKGYPMTAIDNKSNQDLDALYAQISSVEKDDMEANNGFYKGTGVFEDTMLNTNGLYRFPNRANATKMFDSDDETITINGVTFKIPDINDPLFASIKEKSIGCYFVRAENTKDSITQGVLFNTMSVPNFEFFRQTDFYGLSQYAGQVYTDSNSMSIPMYNYMMEASQRYVVDNNGGGTWLGQKNIKDDGIGEDPGLFVQHFVQRTSVDTSFVNLYNKKKFAFLSSDIWSEKETFISRINNLSVKFDTIYRVTNNYAIPTPTVFSGDGGKDADPQDAYQVAARGWSVIRPRALAWSSATKEADMSFVVGGTKAFNADKFGGGALFATNPAQSLGESGGLNTDYRNVVLKNDILYNDYCGLYLKNDELEIASGYPQWDNESDCSSGIQVYADTLTDAMMYANIYDAGGQRTPVAIEGTYGNADNLVYYPITNKMYWDDTIKEADPTNTLEGALIDDVTDRRIVAFGGDTYVGSSFRKLFYNARPLTDNTIDGVESAKTNVGYTMQFFHESTNNQVLRNETIVDELTEDSKRTFKPYEATAYTYSTQVDGSDNYWRKDERILETSGYNKGYADTITRKSIGSILQTAPFSRESWLARVWYSAKHIPNSFQNSYRIWGGTAYQDFDTSLGEIIAIRVFNNALYVIQENGIGVLSVNERVETGSDSAGAIFIESNSVLSPYIGQLTSMMGSKYKESIQVTENGMYGYSEEQSKIWKIGRDGLNNTSDLNIGSFLMKNGGSWRNGTTNVFLKNIRSHYDVKNKEVVFAFVDGENSFTLGYFEPLGIFTSFYTYVPNFIFAVYDEMYSHKGGKLWRHDADESDRVSFYGGDFSFSIHFIVNDNVIGTKVYENLQLVSNNELPDEIVYKVQGAKSTQAVNYDPENIHLSNAFYRDEKVLVSVPVVDEVTNESASGYVPISKDNALSLLQSTAKMRGKTMRVEITYGTQKQLRLQSVVTFYRRSFS